MLVYDYVRLFNVCFNFATSASLAQVRALLSAILVIIIIIIIIITMVAMMIMVAVVFSQCIGVGAGGRGQSPPPRLWTVERKYTF